MKYALKLPRVLGVRRVEANLRFCKSIFSVALWWRLVVLVMVVVVVVVVVMVVVMVVQW